MPSNKPKKTVKKEKNIKSKKNVCTILYHTFSMVFQILAYLAIIIAVFSSNIFQVKTSQCEIYGGLFSTCYQCSEKILKNNTDSLCNTSLLYIRDGTFTNNLGGNLNYILNLQSAFSKAMTNTSINQTSSNLMIETDTLVLSSDLDLVQMDLEEDLGKVIDEGPNLSYQVQSINDSSNDTHSQPKGKPFTIIVSTLFFTNIFDTLINQNFASSVHSCCYLLFMVGIAIFTVKLITMALFFFSHIAFIDIILGIIVFILFTIPAAFITHFLIDDVKNSYLVIEYYSSFYMIWISIGLILLASLFDIMIIFLIQKKSRKYSLATPTAFTPLYAAKNLNKQL